MQFYIITKYDFLHNNIAQKITFKLRRKTTRINKSEKDSIFAHSKVT